MGVDENSELEEIKEIIKNQLRNKESRSYDNEVNDGNNIYNNSNNVPEK